MHTDRWGHEITTTSAEAAEALDQGIFSFVKWRVDTMDHISRATKLDPDCTLAQALRGILVTGLRKPEAFPVAEKALAEALRTVASATWREKKYVEILDALLKGQADAAMAAYEVITQAHPLDLIAHRLAQFEMFWIGDAAWMQAVVERAAPAWSEDIPGYASFCAVRSFSNEEANNQGDAETYGRRAIELDPGECWAAHAVAHVMVMQGRLEDGVAWVSGLENNWDGANHIKHHLWWHLALFHVEGGEYEAPLEIYDNKLRDPNSPLLQAIPDMYIDIQNNTAMLKRLGLRGVEVGERWNDMADFAAQRIGNHTSPFTSAHCVMALAETGRFDEAEETVRQMEAFCQDRVSTYAPRYALAGVPVGKAVIAHSKGEHERVVKELEPYRRNFWMMGGSHAQRDLFVQILIDSARKTGRTDLIKAVLNEQRASGFNHLEERSSYAETIASLA